MNKEPSEIAKLTERIAKDPKSKLFVPLAEEYKRSGDTEMAVHVLMEGLKNNPGYVTARSFLGKLLIEQGNLVDAQKEFEEVIKAIPDNLMAQRKLGDLLVLQNNPGEALKHYKSVIALNPKDGETVALVAELEAGRDARKLVPAPKILAVAEAQPEPPRPAAAQPTSAKTTPVAAPASSEPAAALKPPAVEPAQEEAEEVLVVEPLEPEAAAAEAPQAAPSAEEAFDFLAERESADHAAGPDEAFAAPASDFEARPEPFPADAAEEQAPALEAPEAEPFGLAEMPEAGAEAVADVQAEPFAIAEEHAVSDEPLPSLEAGSSPEQEEPFALSEQLPVIEEAPSLEAEEPPSFPEMSAPSLEEEIAPIDLSEPVMAEELPVVAGEPLEAIVLEEPLAAEPALAQEQEEPVFVEEIPLVQETAAGEELPQGGQHDEGEITVELVEETEKKADDFTTDTLAELYISQGFFEKAIDIYERLLADHPDSAALKDKLARVREMASASGQEAEHEAGPGTAAAEEPVPGPDVFVPATPGFVQPRLDDWELPATTATPVSTDAPIPRPTSQPKPFEVGFEPREYVPPDALPRKGEPARTTGQPASESAAPQQTAPVTKPGEPAVNTKETVERLESWLKNIMKET